MDPSRELFYRRHSTVLRPGRDKRPKGHPVRLHLHEVRGRRNVTDWHDFTSGWASSPYDDQVAAAFGVQRSGGLEPPPIQRWLDEEANFRVNQVKDWFAVRGLVLQLRSEGDTHFADLILRETGKVLGRSYDEGTTPATAAESAQKRYWQEQSADPLV